MCTCTKYLKQLNAYIDGELSEKDRTAIEHHVQQCADCSQQLTELRNLTPLLRQLETPTVPDGLAIDILAKAVQRASSHRTEQGRVSLHQSESVSQQRHSLFSALSESLQALLFQPWMMKGVTTAALIFGLSMGGWMGDWIGQATQQRTMSQNTMSIEAASLYAFDTLSTNPKGSLEAAAITLLGE